jgi:hypothetical protein
MQVDPAGTATVGKPDGRLKVPLVAVNSTG